jgi:hypothetical protein
VHVVNPAALAPAELFGAADLATGRWRDGVLPRVLRGACRGDAAEETWVVLDGTIDRSWAEDLSALLDDNRVLTLPSGERLAVPPQVTETADMYSSSS